MTDYVLYKLILVSAIFGITLLIAMYSTYFERKVAAFIQDRVGPDRAGPFGILQPLADGVKFFMKEEIIPNVSNKTLFILGPCIAMMTALMVGGFISWWAKIAINGMTYHLQIVDNNIRVLCIFTSVFTGGCGIIFGGCVV